MGRRLTVNTKVLQASRGVDRIARGIWGVQSCHGYLSGTRMTPKKTGESLAVIKSGSLKGGECASQNSLGASTEPDLPLARDRRR